MLGFKPQGDNLHQQERRRRIARPYIGTRSVNQELAVEQLRTKRIYTPEYLRVSRCVILQVPKPNAIHPLQHTPHCESTLDHFTLSVGYENRTEPIPEPAEHG